MRLLTLRFKAKISLLFNVSIVMIILYSCISDSEKRIILFNRIESLSDWELVSKTSTDSYDEFIYYKSESDTLYNLVIYENKFESTDTIKYICTKAYYVNNYEFTLVGNADTLVFYMTDTLIGNKTFFVGEYYYDFKNFALSPSQTKYYTEHEDSLINIRGNDLPDIPINLEFDKSFVDTLLIEE